MPPDYRKGGPGDALGGLAVLSLIALFNFALPHVPWWPALIILAFDAFGLLLLYNLLARLHQSLRFTPAVVAWPTFPVRTGGRLEASVRFRAALQSTGPPVVTVRCVRDGMGGGTAGEQDPGQVRAISIYRATRSLPAPAPLRRLDVAFDVPNDLPGTNLTSENPVYWQLLVRVPISGPDFETVFLAPVYSASVADRRHPVPGL
jgi:hypothetical protein